MAVGIVDCLEVVKVHHCHAESLACAGAAQLLVGQHRHQVAPVVYPGQFVADRHVLDGLHRHFELGLAVRQFLAQAAHVSAHHRKP